MKYIQIDSEFINLDQVTSFQFFKDKTYYGVKIWHGTTYTVVRVPLIKDMTPNKYYTIIESLEKHCIKNRII